MKFEFDKTMNNERKTMEKKFKLNDGAKTFVEVNTLLEPANNSSSV
jgi:hypothetical protein